eukprot:3375513-Pyramimonas_sp.AAC.1
MLVVIIKHVYPYTQKKRSALNHIDYRVSSTIQYATDQNYISVSTNYVSVSTNYVSVSTNYISVSTNYVSVSTSTDSVYRPATGPGQQDWYSWTVGSPPDVSPTTFIVVADPLRSGRVVATHEVAARGAGASVKVRRPRGGGAAARVHLSEPQVWRAGACAGARPRHLPSGGNVSTSRTNRIKRGRGLLSERGGVQTGQKGLSKRERGLLSKSNRTRGHTGMFGFVVPF